MPTLLSQRHNFLSSAKAAHDRALLDFPAVFDSYWESGYVFKGPDYMLMGHEDPGNDAWIVWYAECTDPRVNAVKLFLKHVPYYRSQIGWARGLRGKLFKFYSTERLLKFM